ncbi:MAG: L-threonylcarbamoyladenylate synthase [Bacteroidales bacterium]|nr:L-threonylcarbamoyladenylate synthase [Bacteroidales bacterium]
MDNITQEVENSLKTLLDGGTILYPTDTIWGIGCDATNAKAVEKIYKIKQRVESRSLIILLDDVEKLQLYVGKIPDITFDLLDSVDAPLTVIYPNARSLARNVVAADNTIAIRIVKEPFCQALIKAFNKPIVSTSANVSNEPTALIFNKISKKITSQVDYIVNLYQDQVNKTKPSTIIRLFENGDYKVIRN